jgi:hypothetical protein
MLQIWGSPALYVMALDADLSTAKKVDVLQTRAVRAQYPKDPQR